MSILKEGSLKTKLNDQTKWHRRYCTLDWDKSILFLASRADTRYRDWIKLLPNIIINDSDCTANSDCNANSSLYIIEIKDGKITHLLQTENKTDHENWLVALKRTSYSRVGGAIFGQSLDETYRYSPDKSSLVPSIVRQCCEYLLEHGLTFVGLFRVPGKQSAIKELRDMYDRGLSVEFKSIYSPATIASLLKTYLQSLPEPIIPTKYFDEFLEIGSLLKYSQTNELNRLKQLIDMNLSNINYAILAYLCFFLKKLTDHVQVTKMDTDNLAVVFGNNLIRPAEELDLNMLKGHNYNLLPLIKTLIDHSEYLFSNSSINQYQDSFEHTTDSVTKSSGFSSFSSLLSASETPITRNSRSSSMPSLHMMVCSTYPRENDLNPKNSLEILTIGSRPASAIEKLDPSKQLQLSTEQFYTRKIRTIRHKRFPSTDLLGNNDNHDRMKHNQRSMDNILLEQKPQSDRPSSVELTSDGTIPARKMDKYVNRKTFANKFGKSFYNLKSSMSKALQSHGSSNEPESQTNNSAGNVAYQRKSMDSQLASNPLKKFQNDIDILQELLEKKDLLILELTNNSREERLQFEKIKWQMNQKIEQLQEENLRLQQQLNMQ